MGIASFYWNALGLVFDGSLERAEGILFLATLGISFLTEMLPAFKVRGRNVIPRSVHTWRIMASILGLIIVVGLIRAPYQLWEYEHAQRVAAETELHNPITVTFQWAGEPPFLQPVPSGDFWIRVRAINSSARDVVCRVFLTLLKKNGENRSLWSGETMLLYWTGSEDEFPGNNERTVEPGPLGKLFNLAYIHKDANEMTIQNPQFANQVSEKLSPGTYIFTVQASYSVSMR